ncbi:hypothetical protein CRENBAI_018958 [Crenichthys baileyi]|uniref:Uncharacterized protein n=1 Tax=Crenichthys baileyi TaxID=28760 RepID=A0AAV9SAL1_9TELE
MELSAGIVRRVSVIPSSSTSVRQAGAVAAHSSQLCCIWSNPHEDTEAAGTLCPTRRPLWIHQIYFKTRSLLQLLCLSTLQHCTSSEGIRSHDTLAGYLSLCGLLISPGLSTFSHNELFPKANRLQVPDAAQKHHFQ